MAPRIGDQLHTFEEHGLYDGLFLMRDDETETYWDHMTGEALYGPLTGTRLEVSNLLQSNVAQVLGDEPEAMVALSDRILWEDEQLGLTGLISSMGGKLGRMFSSTVDAEDDRRPTMDLGMGIWEGEAARYYPYDVVLAAGRAVLDTFQSKKVLVFLDPTAYALSAYYVDVTGFEWEDEILRLSDGSYIDGGVLYDSTDERGARDRPLQVFTRWYGFSLTFPETEIYGEGG